MAQTAPTLAIDGTRPAGFGRLTLRMSEDHPTADRLQNSHHGHRQLGADVSRTVLNDDHGAVLEVAHGLTGLLPLLDHADGYLLTGKDDLTDSLREIVHVQDGDALELGNAVQAVVVCHDGDAEGPRQRDELAVGAGPGGVLLRELDLDGLLLLHLREHLETAPTALAAGSIRRVVEVLKLGQNELWDDERAPDKTAPDDVGDAAVDDDRGVEQHARIVGSAAPNAAHALRERAQLVSFDGPGRRPHDTEHDRRHQRRVAPYVTGKERERERDEEREHEPDGGAERPADEIASRRRADPLDDDGGGYDREVWRAADPSRSAQTHAALAGSLVPAVLPAARVGAVPLRVLFPASVRPPHGRSPRRPCDRDRVSRLRGLGDVVAREELRHPHGPLPRSPPRHRRAVSLHAASHVPGDRLLPRRRDAGDGKPGSLRHHACLRDPVHRATDSSGGCRTGRGLRRRVPSVRRACPRARAFRALAVRDPGVLQRLAKRRDALHLETRAVQVGNARRGHDRALEPEPLRLLEPRGDALHSPQLATEAELADEHGAWVRRPVTQRRGDRDRQAKVRGGLADP